MAAGALHGTFTALRHVVRHPGLTVIGVSGLLVLRHRGGGTMGSTHGRITLRTASGAGVARVRHRAQMRNCRMIVHRRIGLSLNQVSAAVKTAEPVVCALLESGCASSLGPNADVDWSRPQELRSLCPPHL